jgi:Fic family protein
MQIKFKPQYMFTPQLVAWLMRIEAIREKVLHLPLTVKVYASLKETARLYTTHYSTMIEGNELEPNEIEKVLKHKEHFPGREREEHEVKGYYAALMQVEQWVAQGKSVTELMIQTLHALLMSDGRTQVKPSPYRDGQNVVRDGRTRVIVYMPPEAKDVPALMKAMVNWIVTNKDLPNPIMAGIAHYQFATIHPYYDGNGRAARLLTTLILHLGGYDLKGIYSLEEYYVRNLNAYYDAINVGPSHNYYEGRAKADITAWLEYFVQGMVISLENVLKQMEEAQEEGGKDQSGLIRKLDPRQRKALSLFEEFEIITAKQIGDLFGFKPRTSAQLCKDWVEGGFLKIVDYSNKGRKYVLTKQYKNLI